MWEKVTIYGVHLANSSWVELIWLSIGMDGLFLWVTNFIRHLYGVRKFYVLMQPRAHPSGHAVWGAGLRPLACWGCGFESRQVHGCLSVVSVVCVQVEVCVSSWSLVQRNPTECSVSECYREASLMRSPWPNGGCCATRVGGTYKVLRYRLEIHLLYILY
jgi:hypothetical protein